MRRENQGDWINHGSVGGDSTVCTEAVAKRLGPGPGQLRDVEFWLYAMFYPHHELQEIDPLQHIPTDGEKDRF